MNLNFSYDDVLFDITGIQSDFTIFNLKETVAKSIPNRKPKPFEIIFNNSKMEPLSFELEGENTKKISEVMQEGIVYFISLKKQQNFLQTRSESQKGISLEDLSPERSKSPSESPENAEKSKENAEKSISDKEKMNEKRKDEAFMAKLREDFEAQAASGWTRSNGTRGTRRMNSSLEEEPNSRSKTDPILIGVSGDLRKVSLDTEYENRNNGTDRRSNFLAAPRISSVEEINSEPEDQTGRARDRRDLPLPIDEVVRNESSENLKVSLQENSPKMEEKTEKKIEESPKEEVETEQETEEKIKVEESSEERRRETVQSITPRVTLGEENLPSASFLFSSNHLPSSSQSSTERYESVKTDELLEPNDEKVLKMEEKKLSTFERLKTNSNAEKLAENSSSNQPISSSKDETDSDDEEYPTNSFLFTLSSPSSLPEEDLKIEKLTPDHVIEELSTSITAETVRNAMNQDPSTFDVNLDDFNYDYETAFEEMMEQLDTIEYIAKLRLDEVHREISGLKTDSRGTIVGNVKNAESLRGNEVKKSSGSSASFVGRKTTTNIPTSPTSSHPLQEKFNQNPRNSGLQRGLSVPEFSRTKGEESSSIIKSAESELKAKRASRLSQKLSGPQKTTRREDLSQMNESEKKEKQMKFRAVVDELIQTERDYIDDLEIANTIFYQPMSLQNIVSPNDLNELFSNILCILEINKIILEELEKRRADPNGPGNIFMQYNDYLMIYLQYCAHQDRQLALIKELQAKNRTFANFLITARKNPTCRLLTFDSFLSRPVQRICKYPLLLKELINFATESEQHKILTVALRKMTDCITEINTRMRFTQGIKRMLEIQSLLRESLPEGFEILQPGRRIVKEGMVGKISQGRNQDRYFFLFNDLLIYTRVATIGKKGHTFRGMIHLGKATLTDIPEDGKNGYRFTLARKYAKTAPYIIVLKTFEDKNSWMKSLKDSICRPDRQSSVNSAEMGLFLATVEQQAPGAFQQQQNKITTSPAPQNIWSKFFSPKHLTQPLPP